jgi:HSP20 family molecular chaperone IbpA
MYRSEVTIPVHRDTRTFEQGRHDLLDNLEKNLRTRHTSTTSTSSVSSRQINTSSNNSKNVAGALVPFDQDFDEWDTNVSQWIRESRTKWDVDLQRMRHDLFRLEDYSPAITDWPHNENLGGHVDSHTKTTIQQSSTVSKSTTIGGQTTTQSQKTNSFSTNTGGNAINQQTQQTQQQQQQQHLDFNQGSNQIQVVDKKNTNSGLDITNAFSQSKDLYELGEDGQMHFKVRFDASEFSPEDIQVTTSGNRLTVKARVEKRTANSSSFKEMSRSVELPDRIDHDKFSCVITKDNVLVIDAPVKAPNYKAISFSNGELGIKPLASSEVSTNQLQVTGRTGTQVISTSEGKRMHVEVTVEKDYLPSDIHVRAEGHKIYIKGVHHENSGGRTSMKEFSKYYEVPEALDPLSVIASLRDGVLVIEAPLAHQ